MSQNQKIKSITVINELTDEILFTFRKIEHTKIEIEYEYEKPKSKALFETVEPERGTAYYWIGTWGDVNDSFWFDKHIDNHLFLTNNVFLTEENAQKQADRLKLLADIERFAVENNGGIDWCEDQQYKYYFFYNQVGEYWHIDGSIHRILGVIYFSSSELATQALEKFKDRLDLLLD